MNNMHGRIIYNNSLNKVLIVITRNKLYKFTLIVNKKERKSYKHTIINEATLDESKGIKLAVSA